MYFEVLKYTYCYIAPVESEGEHECGAAGHE